MPELAPVTIIVRGASGMRLTVGAVLTCDALRESGVVLALGGDGRRHGHHLPLLRGQLREHLRDRLFAAVIANDTETQLVRGAIEWRQRCERARVGGTAPPERAERAA